MHKECRPGPRRTPLSHLVPRVTRSGSGSAHEVIPTHKPPSDCTPSHHLPASSEQGKCCFKHCNSHTFLSSSEQTELSMRFPANPKYLENYQSIPSFSQDLFSSIKILFSNPSLIKQK